MRWPVILVCLAMLSACAVEPRVSNDIDRIAELSAADLAAATADAETHGDVLAAACYPALSRWVDQLQARKPPPPIGAFSAFQLARDGVKDGGGGFPLDVKLNCAAFYIDVKGDVMKLISLLAQIAAGTYAPPAVLP